DLRGTDDRLIDTAKAGQKHCHDETRRLPDCSDHQAIDDAIRINQPVKAEAFPTPVAQQFVQAHARVEQPFPGATGDDHRERQRVQINGADKSFATNALVEEYRQYYADYQADADEHATEPREIFAGYPPAVVIEQTLVLSQSGPLVGRQKGRGGERQYERPQDIAVEAHQNDEHAWRQHQFG